MFSVKERPSGQSIEQAKSDVRVFTETEAGSIVTVLTNGFIFPPTRRPKASMSITDEHGLPVRNGISSSKHSVQFPRYLTQAERADVTFYKGRCFFGGFYFPHFGHFIFETLSRLWAYEAYKDQIDELIFFTSMRKDPDPSLYKPILDHLGIVHPIRFVRSPMQCKKLIVPRQGIGMGPFASGTPEQRAFMQGKLSKITDPASDCEKIYISRTGYRLKRGGMLCEQIIETNLEQQGYKIFHPQLESFETQIATYLGAKTIVSPDSSALHVAAFVGHKDQQIAILLRRKFGAVDLLPQLSAFCGREPLVIDAIQRVWVQQGRTPTGWGHYAEIAFEDVYEQLLANGYIDEGIPWRNVGPWLVKRALENLKDSYGGELEASPPTIDAPSLVSGYFAAS